MSMRRQPRRLGLPARAFSTLSYWSPSAVDYLWHEAQPFMWDVKDQLLRKWAPGTSAFREVKLTEKELIE